ncbi:hypothetical protein ACFW81_23730 [Streptomyces angustmyceticus]|uniref:hypothetical protein n=1 Tax=Streptomyces angustmyceticus TaxID=285578 RepID=UPI0036AF804E
MTLTLSIIGALFIAAGFLTSFHPKRLAPYKSMALTATGAALTLVRNVIDHNQFWSGLWSASFVGLVLAVVASYRQHQRKTGGAR